MYKLFVLYMIPSGKNLRWQVEQERQRGCVVSEISWSQNGTSDVAWPTAPAGVIQNIKWLQKPRVTIIDQDVENGWCSYEKWFLSSSVFTTLTFNTLTFHFLWAQAIGYTWYWHVCRKYRFLSRHLWEMERKTSHGRKGVHSTDKWEREKQAISFKTSWWQLGLWNC